MAICVNCKKNVGCGCQLVNGLCSTCRDPKTNQVIQQNQNTNNNANSTNNNGQH